MHGNPNVLTRDAGTSRLAQGCTGQLSLVEIERFADPVPRITAFDPPPSATARSMVFLFHDEHGAGCVVR